MNNQKTIVVVAGRSGGHILPALTVAKQHKKKDPHLRIVCITTATPLDFALLKSQPDIEHRAFNLGGIPSRKIQYPFYFILCTLFFIKSFFIIRKLKPEKIISTGGYISLPVCFAALWCKIPIELYELNAVPGKTIELLARCATTLYTPFVSAQKKLAHYQCILHPYPLRWSESDKIPRNQALDILGFSHTRKTLLILGGSQGSVFINHILSTWLQDNHHLAHSCQIIHQTGNDAAASYQTLYRQKGIPAHVFEYHDNLSMYYNAADLIICRAGAGTLFETLFFQKPCIVIPLQTATTSHQLDNAHQLAQQYPTLITILTHQELMHDSTALGRTINHLLTPVPANHPAYCQNP